jgi:hypothetical protein
MRTADACSAYNSDCPLCARVDLHFLQGQPVLSSRWRETRPQRRVGFLSAGGFFNPLPEEEPARTIGSRDLHNA